MPVTQKHEDALTREFTIPRKEPSEKKAPPLCVRRGVPTVGDPLSRPSAPSSVGRVSAMCPAAFICHLSTYNLSDKSGTEILY